MTVWVGGTTGPKFAGEEGPLALVATTLNM